MSAELTMTANILNTIEVFLAEVGAPLTPQQRVAFRGVRDQIAEQSAQVAEFDRLVSEARRSA